LLDESSNIESTGRLAVRQLVNSIRKGNKNKTKKKKKKKMKKQRKEAY
jgi:hypothetical protein